MNQFLLDASALVKRYCPELGSPLLDHLFANTSSDRLCCLMLGVAETAATLARKRNSGVLSTTHFAFAMRQLRAEVLQVSGFLKCSARNPLVEASIPWSDRYAINSNDALVLHVALLLATDLRVIGDDLVLVAADQRLLRAAQAEGLTVFDPETQPQADLEGLIAA